jgi:hypothetical protein
MVLWGIDMQVTDEMVMAGLSAWFNEPVNEPYDEHVDNMRFAIQAAIQAAWVSVDDMLPNKLDGFHISDRFLILQESKTKVLLSGYTKDSKGKYAFDVSSVAYWMPLPEFKEIHNDSNR